MRSVYFTGMERVGGGGRWGGGGGMLAGLLSVVCACTGMRTCNNSSGDSSGISIRTDGCCSKLQFEVE